MSRQYWGETLNAVVADGSAITNSTTEAILFPNVTIPANYVADGRTLRLTVRGKISNVVTTPGNITLRLRWGGVAGTILCQSAAIAMSATAFTNAIFELQIEMTVRVNGASGSVLALGQFCSGNLSTVTPNYLGSAGATAPAAVTVDLTADTALAITAQFSVANASNSITGMEYILEALN